MVFRGLLGFLDRLSTQSTLTGHTASIFGVIATLGLLTVCIIIYIIPIVSYFQGDYFSAQFTKYKPSSGQFVSYRDFKLAILFKNKQTGTIANHTQILNQLTGKYSLTTDNNKYLSYLDICQSTYFNNTVNDPKLSDCIKIPDNKLFDGKGKITIQLTFKCPNPFLCIFGTQIFNKLSNYSINLFTNYYYQILVTSKIIDKVGQSKLIVNKIYSTQYQALGAITGWVNLYYTLVHNRLDNSILPWRSNKNIDTLRWYGYDNGIALTDIDVSTIGVQVSISLRNNQGYSYRYYRKLDWLLGIIGGGVYLFFLIFWVLFTYINRTFQKIYNVRKLFLQYNQQQNQSQIQMHQSRPGFNKNNLKSAIISYFYFICGILPTKSKDQQLMILSQNKIGIQNLVKKLKVAYKNLQINLKKPYFEPKNIQFQQIHQNNFINNNNLSDVVQINQNIIKTFQQSRQTRDIYQNNITMLTIIDKKQHIQAILPDERLDKLQTNINKNPKSIIKRIPNFIFSCIRFVDVFSIPINFITQPHNSSLWGLFVTLVIIALSILTFSVTLQNIGNPITYIQYSKLQPKDIYVKMLSGSAYKLAFCVPSLAITNSIFTGLNRTVDLKFFTYQRYQNKSIVQNQYAMPLIGINQSYFAKTATSSSVNQSSCFKIPDNINILQSGGYNQKSQSYFGIKLKPYCFGTPTQCLNKVVQSNTNFYDFLNKYSLGIILPQNSIDPDTLQVSTYGTTNQLFQALTANNVTTAIQQTLFLDQVNIFDDNSSSILRKPPILVDQRLAVTTDTRNQITRDILGVSPYYKLIIKGTGQVIKIVRSTYKIDFLFGTVGGIFLFFYFFFYLFGKVYNAFKSRSHLASAIYDQDMGDQNCFKDCCKIGCHLSKIPICCIPSCCGCKMDIERTRLTDYKIKNDLNYLQLIKKVDNCYKLSSSFFQTLPYKDISLIYLRQKINQNMKVKHINPDQQPQQPQVDVDVDGYFGIQQQQDNTRMKKSSKVANQSSLSVLSHKQSHHQLQQKSKIQQQYQSQKLIDQHVYKQNKNKIIQAIQTIDAFSVPPQLTFKGKRSIKSVFGGCCCIGLTILIVITAYYFTTIYLDGSSYFVGYQLKIANQKQNTINIKTGQNFKFMYTFYTKSHYQFMDISSFNNSVGIKAVQVTITKSNGNITKNQVSYQFNKCSDSYLKNWIGSYRDPQYYQSLLNGYCLPDGLQLQISGTPQSQIKKYFYFSIYNKIGTSTGLADLKTFVGKYLTMYHYSVPIKDFKKQLKYQIISQKQNVQLISKSIDYNISMSKYQLFINSQKNDRISTYNFPTYSSYQRKSTHNMNDTIAWKNLTFSFNGQIQSYTIIYTKISQIFGVIGGTIAFFIFGIGCCVSSFNYYKFQYLLGKQLYQLIPVEKIKKKKNQKSKKQLKQQKIQFNNYWQSTLIICWLLSPIANFIRNYNFWNTLRRITLLRQKIQKDINLYQFYKKLNSIEMKINKQRHLQLHKDIKLTRIYLKDIYLGQSIPNTQSDFIQLAKTNKLSSYQQKKLMNGKNAKIRSQKVFQQKYMKHYFSDNSQNISAIKLVREQSSNKNGANSQSHQFEQILE